MTAQTTDHWCKQGIVSVLTPNPGVSQRLQGPIRIPCHQEPPSMTGSQRRHGSRIVRFLSFYTGGASKRILKWLSFFKGLWNSQQYQISLLVCTHIPCKVLDQPGKLCLAWPFPLKPYCWSYKRSCLSRCLTKCEVSICSSALQSIQVTEIGP